ncbi:MAG: condensation domain-containing protein, partial [Acidobacteriota bacterium]|nr:condensation domain-containing protein [Acidobacteriota bacterium]
WAEVLKVEKISTDENFFDLGGHSLLATQVISRIRRVLGVDLPLRTMFDVPTVSRIAQSIEAARLPGGEAATSSITAVRRDGPLPLSYAQQRLWILDQMEPNNHLYNIPRAMRLRGQLDVAALTRSLNEIVCRHEPLRTWFGTESGGPVQHVDPALELHVKQVDLTQHPAEEREAKALEIAVDEATTPFDLSVAPLLRAVLLKLDAQDHVLLLTMHHIVSDAWSAAIFMDELRALYEGFVKGVRADLPELTLQYADYAAWQRDWLQGDTLETQLAFWREQLAGAPPLLTLPTDRPRPEKQSFAGGLVKCTLPPDVCIPLKTLCRKEGVTLFMALLAGYQILLSRLSGQEQVVVGTDSANRFTVETERMIGFFINLLALKMDFAGDPTFRDVLGRVRETTLACYARQEMPFDKIVEELRPDRTLSHNPILQVLFVMQNAPKANRQFGGLEVGNFDVPLTRSKFDIAVFAVERGDSVECIWVYSTELFEASTVTNMAEMLGTLLASAVANPEARISVLTLHGEERQKKLKEERRKRKQTSKGKLMSAELKTVDMGSGAGD